MEHQCISAASAVGDLLSGIAALVASIGTVVGVVRGLNAFEAWAKRRRTEKQAHEAAKIAEAAFRMIEALREVRDPPTIRSAPEGELRQARFDLLNERWTRIESPVKSFLETFAPARAYMPYEVLDELTKLRALIDKVRGAQRAWATGVESSYDPSLIRKVNEEAFGDRDGQIARRLFDSEHRLTLLLRPLAELDTPTSDPSSKEVG